MSQRHGPRSPGWHAFLRNHTAHIAGIDLFVVPTVGFKLLYGLVILRLERRQLVWTNVTANPTAEWISQITEAFPWEEAPRDLIRDRDTSYGAAVTRRLRAMGIRDRPITPRSPWQNGHVERLIGSIRTRVPRPCRGVRGTAPPPSVGELRRPLQWGAHAPCTRQGYAAPSTCADSRAYRISHLARRSPSVLRSDGIIGRHSRTLCCSRCVTAACWTGSSNQGQPQIHQAPRDGIIGFGGGGRSRSTSRIPSSEIQAINQNA